MLCERGVKKDLPCSVCARDCWEQIRSDRNVIFVMDRSMNPPSCYGKEIYFCISILFYAGGEQAFNKKKARKNPGLFSTSLACSRAPLD